MKDPRPATYMYTHKRTVAQLSVEELQIALCDVIDSFDKLREEILPAIEHASECVDDNFAKDKL